MSETLGSSASKENDQVVIKKSICNICDPTTQCGLDVHVKDGVIVKVEGTKENPHSAGTLCSKGAATRQFVYHADRLQHPMKRVGERGSDDFVPVSWDEAIGDIAEKLLKIREEAGPESVVFYAGYPKWMRPYLQRLTHSFGSPNYCTESSVCFQAMAMAWTLLYGSPAAPDIRNTKCLLVWSSNPFYTNTCLARGLLDAREKGMKMIVIDPRVSPMAGHADIHLQLRPGTDGALALTMANVIIENKLYDEEFVKHHTVGFDEYREYISKFSLEEGERLTGVPAEKIKEAALLYATTKPAAFMASAAPVVHNTNGVQNYRAAMALVGLTGNFDVTGGNRVIPPSYNYMPGGFVTREHQYAMPKSWDEMAARIGDEKYPVWKRLVDQGQSMQIPFQVHSGQPYPLKALVAFGLNYRMWPDSNHMLEALKKLDLVVVVDLFLTDSSKYADYILPACSSLERSELRCYPQNYAVLSEPAIEPLFESRSDVEIIFDLARRMKLDDPLLEKDYDAALDWILEPSTLTVDELKKHPGGMFVPDPMKVDEKKYLKKGFPTPTGKMELKSSVLADYAEEFGYYALPVYQPPKHSAEATPELAKEYPMILNTGTRLPMFVHSRTFRLSWTKSLRPLVAADLNPDDAARLNVSQDETIFIATPKGRIKVQANLTNMVMPGVVHMYHGYAEANVNELIEPDYLDPISSFPGFKSLLCKIEKA